LDVAIIWFSFNNIKQSNEYACWRHRDDILIPLSATQNIQIICRIFENAMKTNIGKC